MRKKKISSRLRKEVYQRAKNFCEYCRTDSEISESPFDVEHIISEAEGGLTILDNLALSCHGCNLHKSRRINNIDPLSGKTERLFDPRKDEWNKHFTWTEDYTIVVGITPIGRVTIDTLKMNRPGLVRKRSVLRRSGERLPG
jgi:hypothetical protein